MMDCFNVRATDGRSCRAVARAFDLVVSICVIALVSAAMTSGRQCWGQAKAGDVASETRSHLSWQKVAPLVEGRRWDVPLGTAGESGSLLALGGRTSWADYKKPRPYDVLRWNSTDLIWENEFPAGKDWGPKTGPCQAPAWKDERFHFQDVEGNVRPNWTVYGTFSLGQKYDYDPDTRKFYFYALGRTFSYDPETRAWVDLQPVNDPEKELGGILLWSSMCYDAHNRRFVLFGGGNVRSLRGDAGTWSYSPRDNRWSQLNCSTQPSPRANSRLVYNPVAKKIILFGGDRLNELLNDTWQFDVETDGWRPLQHGIGPSPRAGHAMVWLPKARKVALVGGYTYSSTTGYCESLYKTLPLEVWLFDWSNGGWQSAGRWAAKEGPQLPANSFTSAAARTVGGRDEISVLGVDGLWQLAFDRPLEKLLDERWKQEMGVKNGAVVRRSGSYDPQWYLEGVPSPEPENVAEELRQLPANRWVQRPTPKRPGMNMDWGSAVLATGSDQIMRFSGGHSAYSGTAPVIYDIKTDRYRLPFAPEMPLEYVYSNDQVLGEWSFGGNPWMTGHTYKSTGYDVALKCLVFAPHDYTHFFDSESGRWNRSTKPNPYRADFYNVTLCSTPEGVVAWGDRREGGGDGLWRMDAASRLWRPLPLNGKLPAKSADQHGLAFDSRRNRLLFFSNAGDRRGDVTAYDLASGEAKWLEPPGREHAAVPSRETIYLPDEDLVLLGARAVIDDKQLWLAYDCAKNEWHGLELSGDDPIGKGTFGRSFNNSVGLMYDPSRKLVWAVSQYSHVHVLRLDRSAGVRPLSSRHP